MAQAPNNKADIEPSVEILPPDPRWHTASEATVYEAVEPTSTDPVKPVVLEAVVQGDPKVVNKMIAIGRRTLVALMLLGLYVWLFEPLGPKPVQMLTHWLTNAGLEGRLAVIALYVLLVPLHFPAGPMSVLPGYVWGPLEGTIVALIAATCGGLVNYAVAHYLLGRHFRAWAQRSPLARSVSNTINLRGFRIVLGLRMSPIMPFGLLSYLSGISTLSPLRYAIAVTLGGIPWTTVWAMVGAMMRASGQEVTLDGTTEHPQMALLRWIGLGVTIAIATWVGNLVRKDLALNRESSP